MYIWFILLVMGLDNLDKKKNEAMIQTQQEMLKKAWYCKSIGNIKISLFKKLFNTF